MQIRKSTVEDIPQMLRIYDAARQYMRREGNLQQWSDGYPSETSALADIANGYSHVCIAPDGHICGTFCFQTAPDPTYQKIYNGRWLNDNPYAVIHRIASDGSVSGLLRQVLDYCFTVYDTIRIDTHRDNLTMRRNLSSLGFTLCGIIHLPSGAERLAWMKTEEIKYPSPQRFFNCQ